MTRKQRLWDCVHTAWRSTLCLGLGVTWQRPWPDPCWDRTSALMWNEGLVEIRITEAEHLTATLDRPCMPRVAFMHNCFVFFNSTRACSAHARCGLSYSAETDRNTERRPRTHRQRGDTGSTYLLQGHEHRPQNCPRLFKFFSASIMSLLIWSIPSSMRSSCSVYQQNVKIFFFFPEQMYVREAMRKKKKKENEGGDCGRKRERGGEERGKQRRQKKRHILWQERDIGHQTSPPPPPLALDRQEHEAPVWYLLFNTWAYQTTALS